MLGLLCTLLILQIWLGFIVAQLVLFQLLTYATSLDFVMMSDTSMPGC